MHNEKQLDPILETNKSNFTKTQTKFTNNVKHKESVSSTKTETFSSAKQLPNLSLNEIKKNKEIKIINHKMSLNAKIKVDTHLTFSAKHTNKMKMVKNPYHVEGHKKIDNYLDIEALRSKAKRLNHAQKSNYIDPFTIKQQLKKLPFFKSLFSHLVNIKQAYFIKWRKQL